MNIAEHIQSTRDAVNSNVLFISESLLPDLYRASTKQNPYLSVCKSRFMGLTVITVKLEGIVLPATVNSHNHWNQ